MREYACGAFVNIALTDKGELALVKGGAPAAIVSVLQDTEDFEVMIWGAWALHNVAFSKGESWPTF